MRNRLVIGLLLVAAISCDYKPRNQGRVLYEKHCQSCHMESGQGLGKLIPAVSNADYIQENKSDLSCVIRYGISGPITVNGVEFDGEMDGNSQLSDIEINNLVHYILVDMNQQKEHFDIVQVRAQLEECAK